MADSPAEPPSSPDPVPLVLEQERHDPYAALRFANYRRYFVGNAFATIGTQMAAVTVGWELYARTNSAMALGLVGLVQVLPVLLLSLPAGHIVDRLNRRNIVTFATAILALSYTLLGLSSRFTDQLHAATGPLAGFNHLLAAVSSCLFGERSAHFDSAHIPIMLALLLLNGVCKSVNQPAKAALLPALVPERHFSNAVTWNSSLFEISNVVGPMIGGFLIWWLSPHEILPGAEGGGTGATWAYAVVYLAVAGCQAIQLVNMLLIRLVYTPRPRQPMSVRSMLMGAHFVYRNKVILGAITLDMFAVLLGGATALLPLFAKDILHVGPMGLGWLRAAPSIGALSMAMVVAHQPPMEKAGRNLLWAVVGFGVATVVFGLSRNFWLSMIALVLTGACDNISVVVRHTLVQVMTPDDMRGRVSAVNSMFISSSNELGEFESGTTAAIGIRFFGPMWGPMLAVAGGGLGTILVVALVVLAWPQIGKIGRLTHPETEESATNDLK